MDTFFSQLSSLSLLSITVRLLLTTVFAGTLGYERERHRQAAGFRTYIIVADAAALVMIFFGKFVDQCILYFMSIVGTAYVDGQVRYTTDQQGVGTQFSAPSVQVQAHVETARTRPGKVLVQKERSRSYAQKTLASNFLPGKFHSLEEPSV